MPFEIEKGELQRCVRCQVGQGDDCACRRLAPMPTLWDAVDLLLWLIGSAASLWLVGWALASVAVRLGWLQ